MLQAKLLIVAVLISTTFALPIVAYKQDQLLSARQVDKEAFILFRRTQPLKNQPEPTSQSASNQPTGQATDPGSTVQGGETRGRFDSRNPRINRYASADGRLENNENSRSVG